MKWILPILLGGLALVLLFLAFGWMSQAAADIPPVMGSGLNGAAGAAQMVSEVAAPIPEIDVGSLGLPLRFVPNQGQTDEAVLYTVKSAGQTLFFTQDEVVFQALQGEGAATKASITRLGFVGANPNPEVLALGPMRGVINSYLGNDPADWQVGIPTYRSVAYYDLYPGVDLIYSGRGGRLKSEFRLDPGVDPAVIQMIYQGASAVELREDGALVVSTPLGELVELAPLIYQEVGSVRQQVPGRYQLLGRTRIGFQVEGYDPALPLVIDPELVFSTYLGGSDEDNATNIAVDRLNNMYVVGYTRSTDYYTSTDALSPTLVGVYDVFVTQILNLGGVYTYGFSTYLGGSSEDRCYDVAVDADSNVYLVGRTHSDNFPTQNALDSTLGGADAFVVVLAAQGDGYALALSTYLGGDVYDSGWSIAIDPERNIYVSGETMGITNFPLYKAFQTYFGGSTGDGFVTKIITASGAYTYEFSSLLGADGLDRAREIAVSSQGEIYVTGNTGSQSFPTNHPIQGNMTGYDSFVAKIVDAGDTYSYTFSTYLGGNTNTDSGLAIDVDEYGNIYVTGITGGDQFPISDDALDDTYGGAGDAYVTQIITQSGAYTLGYSSYLGGTETEFGYGILIDRAGSLYLTGHTHSSDFPKINAFDSVLGGYTDFFVVHLVRAGGTYTYSFSTYLGGSAHDNAQFTEKMGLALDNDGNIYIASKTESDDYPNVGAVDSVRASWDGAVSKISVPADVGIRKARLPEVARPGDAVTYTLTYSNSGPNVATAVVITDLVPVELSNVQVISTGVAITQVPGTHYIWRVANLFPGQDGVITLTAVVSSNLTGMVELTNQAVIDALGVDPDASDNVASVSLQVDAVVPAPPTLVAPLDDALINDTTPTLTWNASPSGDVIGYLLNWDGTIIPVGNMTEYTTDALGDGTYTWSVSAYDMVGNNSPYSEAWSFTVDGTAPGMPVLQTPTDNTYTNDVTPTLSWDASPAPDLAGYLLDLSGTVMDLGDVTEYTPDPLADGVYAWRVAAYDQAGNASQYTAPRTFTVDTVAPQPPTLLEPVDGAMTDDATVILMWDASPSADAVGYLLNFNGVITDVGDTTTYTTGLLVPGVYTWTVAGYDLAGNEPVYADVWSFTIYQVISLPSGGGTVTTADGILTFEAPGTLTQTIHITYTPGTTPTHSTGDFELAGVVFHLEATDENGDPLVTISTPISLTIAYDEAALPPDIDEADLELRRYDLDLGEWVPLTVIDRDLAGDTLTVLLDHFSEFALLSLREVKYDVYLPVLMNQYP
jgi:uncharacterized repeat protein (TIGR01451 family)